MQHAVEGERLRSVTDETRGQAIQRRREAVGMTVTELAERATAARGGDKPALDWQTVQRAEDDRSQSATYGLLEKVLADLEEEIGGPPERPEHTVEFLLEGNFGVRVRVKGPVADLPELERSVGRLIKQMGQPSEG